MTDGVVSYTGEMTVGGGDDPPEASVLAAQQIVNPILPMITALQDGDVVMSVTLSVLVTAALRFPDSRAFLDDVMRMAVEGIARAEAEIAGFLGPRQ